MKILQKSSNHAKALEDIQKYENSLDQRRALPHNVLPPIQETLMYNNPDVDIHRTWSTDRLKYYKDYDRLEIFKEAVCKCIAEVRGHLKVSTLEQVFGVQSTDGHDNNGDKDNEDIEEEKEEEEGTGKKVIETMTFSLQCIVRPEMEFGDFLNVLENEQRRVGRCMSELSKGVSVLTDLILSWKLASSVNINVEQDTLNIKPLAPKFDFGTAVAPPPLDEFCIHTKRRGSTGTGEKSSLFFSSYLKHPFWYVPNFFFYLYWAGYISFSQNEVRTPN